MRKLVKRFSVCILMFAFAFIGVNVVSMDEVYGAKVLYSGENTNISWKVYDNGRLTINGTGDANRGFKYNDVSAYEWVQYHNDIKSVKVNLKGMTNISYLFYGLDQATEIDVTNLDTSKVIDMSYLFTDCSKVTKLDVSKFNTAKVTNMGCMFSGCEKLKTLDLSGFNTRKVTLMSKMFENCSSLKKLDLSSFDTTDVVRMDRMFYNCSRLDSVNVSSFNVANTINMEWMFYGCTALKSLDMSGFYLGQIVNMDQMFFDCNKLSCNFTLPKEPLMYAGLFSRTAIEGGKVKVSYGGDCAREVAQEIILKSKSPEANIILGNEDVSVVQPIKLKVANKEYKTAEIKKAQKSFSIGASAKNAVTYKVAKGGKYLAVSSKGKVTVKKGTPKGIYRVTVTAKGSKKYKKIVKQVFVVVK